MNRLSSIDTKYHTWKLGVVLTDNVSLLYILLSRFCGIIIVPFYRCPLKSEI